MASVTFDAAALYRFVASICNLAEKSSSSVYVKASDDFFEYIRELGKRTNEYLTAFPKDLPATERLRSMHRQKLKVLRDAWSEFHTFLKPATDADTLNTPFSLLTALYQKFHKINGLDKVEFTVLHLNEVNYLQVMASWFRQLALKIGSQIPNAPAFPPHLGLIGIPYSQSSAIFLNALIPHEMGHFVYQQLNQFDSLSPKINASLTAELQGTPISAIDRGWCIDKLRSWVEEIFCDLFAVWMVGPAYSFAYIELLDLGNIASLGALPAVPKEHLGFGLRHPADSCRLSEHVKLLKETGWWDSIAGFKTHYLDVLKYVIRVPQSEYTFGCERPHLADVTLRSFFSLLPSVEDAIKAIMKDLEVGSVNYNRWETDVENYLHAGVVPSTVLKGSGAQGAEFEHPDPISVLNVAYIIRCVASPGRWRSDFSERSK